MKLEKILKKLPEQVVIELDALSESALEKVIAQAEEAIAKATLERDENAQYMAARQAVSDLSLGLKDVKSYQNAKIHYALHRLREMASDSNG